MKLNSTKATAFAATLITFGSLAGGANAVNLLLNGDFEGNSLSNGSIGSGVDPVDWTMVSGDVDLVNNNLGVLGSDGPTWLEIGGSDAGVRSTILEQNVLINSTSLHQWSFDYSSWSGGGQFAINFSLFDLTNSQLVDSVSVTPSQGDGVWQTYQGQGLLQAGNEYRFRFDDSQGAANSVQGGIIDGASLSQIPEPSSTLLLGLGSLGLVFCRRRIN